MFFMEYQDGKTRSIWAETTEKWDDTHPSWKTVGASPRRVSKECYGGEGLPLDRPRRASIENLFVCESVYYTVVFPSGREAIGCSRAQHRVGEHVIVEADRGEDCAAIRGRLQVGDGRGAEQTWCGRCDKGPRPRADEQGWPLHGRCACSTGGLAKDAKKILRAATLQDVGILEVRKKQEASALEKCLGLVGEKGYPMEITRCEFQWDMRKITFYFRSSKRVDFRELVKELFKYFKIRIWMSMENRGGAEGKGSSSAAAAGVNGDISNSWLINKMIMCERVLVEVFISHRPGMCLLQDAHVGAKLACAPSTCQIRARARPGRQLWPPSTTLTAKLVML